MDVVKVNENKMDGNIKMKINQKPKQAVNEIWCPKCLGKIFPGNKLKKCNGICKKKFHKNCLIQIKKKWLKRWKCELCISVESIILQKLSSIATVVKEEEQPVKEKEIILKNTYEEKFVELTRNMNRLVSEMNMLIIKDNKNKMKCATCANSSGCATDEKSPGKRSRKVEENEKIVVCSQDQKIFHCYNEDKSCSNSERSSATIEKYKKLLNSYSLTQGDDEIESLSIHEEPAIKSLEQIISPKCFIKLHSSKESLKSNTLEDLTLQKPYCLTTTKDVKNQQMPDSYRDGLQKTTKQMLNSVSEIKMFLTEHKNLVKDNRMCTNYYCPSITDRTIKKSQPSDDGLVTSDYRASLVKNLSQHCQNETHKMPCSVNCPYNKNGQKAEENRDVIICDHSVDFSYMNVPISYQDLEQLDSKNAKTIRTNETLKKIKGEHTLLDNKDNSSIGTIELKPNTSIKATEQKFWCNKCKCFVSKTSVVDSDQRQRIDVKKNIDEILLDDIKSRKSSQQASTSKTTVTVSSDKSIKDVSRKDTLSVKEHQQNIFKSTAIDPYLILSLSRSIDGLLSDHIKSTKASQQGGFDVVKRVSVDNIIKEEVVKQMQYSNLIVEGNKHEKYSPKCEGCICRQGSAVISTDSTSTEKLSAGDDILEVVSIDPKIEQNGPYHKTGMYELMTRQYDRQLVIRRGQQFILQFHLNRPINKDTDVLSLIIYYKAAEYPSVGRKTMITIPVLYTDENITHQNWTAVIDKIDGKTVTTIIYPSPSAIVGIWKLEVDCIKKNSGSTSYSYPGYLYILFNPWCKDDPVYIGNDSLRKEYILNEVGVIWKGAVRAPTQAFWKYGQFDQDVLECALMILDKVAKLPAYQCGDPTLVARAVSAAVNSPDDNGVVLGNWSQDYSGGKHPSEWLGSPKILKKYYGTRKPVKYGQCYVFAGVATTIFRTLGIPARCVTCYKCAHDRGCTLTVDIFLNEDGEKMPEYSSDSIWNYHVWTEIWTKRPDLGSKYDGWQVVDGTPQEISNNLYRCGPAPVIAVKEGEVKRPYDVAFVYSEVNADIVTWRFQGLTQPLKLINSVTTSVGQSISTKAVGSYERDDITSNYKHEERTDEERLTMLKALQNTPYLTSRYYLNESFNDVKFELILLDDIIIGASYKIALIAKNVSEKSHNVKIILRSATVNYNGEVINVVKREEFHTSIAPQQEEKVDMLLEYDDYAPCIKDDCMFNASALCKMKDVDYEYFAQDDFKIKLPEISIKLGGKPVAKQELYGTVSFKNPLPTKLKNCVFLIEGPGLKKGLKYKIDDVPVDGIAKAHFKMVPTFYGKQTIIAKFISSNLSGTEGYLTVEVDEMAENEVN